MFVHVELRTEHHFKMYVYKEIEKSPFGHRFQFRFGKVECLVGIVYTCILCLCVCVSDYLQFLCYSGCVLEE